MAKYSEVQSQETCPIILHYDYDRHHHLRVRPQHTLRHAQIPFFKNDSYFVQTRILSGHVFCPSLEMKNSVKLTKKFGLSTIKRNSTCWTRPGVMRCAKEFYKPAKSAVLWNFQFMKKQFRSLFFWSSTSRQRCTAGGAAGWSAIDHTIRFAFRQVSNKEILLNSGVLHRDSDKSKNTYKRDQWEHNLQYGERIHAGNDPELASHQCRDWYRRSVEWRERFAKESKIDW